MILMTFFIIYVIRCDRDSVLPLQLSNSSEPLSAHILDGMEELTVEQASRIILPAHPSLRKLVNWKEQQARCLTSARLK